MAEYCATSILLRWVLLLVNSPIYISDNILAREKSLLSRGPRDIIADRCFWLKWLQIGWCVQYILYSVCCIMHVTDYFVVTVRLSDIQ